MLPPWRRSPGLLGVLIFCGLVGLAEAYLAHDRFAAAREAMTRLMEREAELAAESARSPQPRAETAGRLERERAEAERMLASLRALFEGSGVAAERLAAPIPVGRTDAYFDLATYAEELRALAERHGLIVRPEAARFGFTAYEHEGPGPERIDAVFRQRLVAGYLLTLLFEARPAALLSVKRGPALAAGQPATVATTQDTGGGETGRPEPDLSEAQDTFTIDPRMTARVPGIIETLAFRVVFIGATSTLRTFLNDLASFGLPVLVRDIEVEPATSQEMAELPVETPGAGGEHPAAETGIPASVLLTADAPAAAPQLAHFVPGAGETRRSMAAPSRRDSDLPIVARTLSRFTVTLEFLQRVSPARTPRAGATPPLS